MEIADQVKALLGEPHWNQQKLAERLGVSQSTVFRWKSGAQPEGHHRDAIRELYAERFESPDDDGTDIPLMGFIGAGAVIEPEFEQTPPEGLEQIRLMIPIPDDMMAFQVRGVSMLPRYDEGDVIIVWREQKRGTDSFLGEEAAVRTLDGRRYLKTIRRSERGYTLESWNDHPIENQEIAWVGEIYVTIRAKQLGRMVRQIQRQGGLQGQFALRSTG